HVCRRAGTANKCLQLSIVLLLALLVSPRCCFIHFFFNATATTELYTLSLHDALPILPLGSRHLHCRPCGWRRSRPPAPASWSWQDRKSTRLNSSHRTISYAVFCLKKKK